MGRNASAFVCAFDDTGNSRPYLKGRDTMNIFESNEGFSGRFDPHCAGSTLQSLFVLAGDIRVKLGKQGYLLDSYLSLFLEGANAMLAYEAAECGFDRGGELRSLCFDMIDRTKDETDHTF